MNFPEIYVVRDGKTLGPFSDEQLQRMRLAGDVRGTDLAWGEGMREWAPLATIIGNTPPPPKTATATSVDAQPQVREAESASRVQNNVAGVVNGESAQQVSVVAEYLFPSGRIGRSQFIVRSAALLVASIAATTLLLSWPHASIASFVPFVLLTCIALFAVQAAKRLHDWDASAGWIFVMISGVGAFVLSLMLVFRRGTRLANRFGRRQATRKATKVSAAAIGTSTLLAAFTFIIVAIVSDGSRSASTAGNRTIDDSALREASPTPAATAAVQPAAVVSAHEETPKTVRGTSFGYSLTVPESWVLKRKGDPKEDQLGNMDLRLSNRGAYIGVIAEEEDLGSSDVVATVAQRTAPEWMTQASFSKSTPVVIDSREWRTFTADSISDNVPMRWRFYVYSGPEGTYQLIGWTVRDAFERNAPALDRGMLSFKFPPDAPRAALPVTSAPDRAAASTDPSPAVPLRESDRAPSLDLPTLARRARPSVVQVEVAGADGKREKTGTGFFISNDGRLVTNWHVIHGGMSAEVKTASGRSFAVQGVLAGSPERDIAILQTAARSVPALDLASATWPEVGTRVAVIGNPLGLEGTLSEGIVSAHRRFSREDNWMQITAPISHGSSGSPVLDDSGQVVAVATVVVRDGQALNFARPVDSLHALVRGIKPGAAPRSLASVQADLMNRLRAVQNEAMATLKGLKLPSDIAAWFEEEGGLFLFSASNKLVKDDNGKPARDLKGRPLTQSAWFRRNILENPALTEAQRAEINGHFETAKALLKDGYFRGEQTTGR